MNGRVARIRISGAALSLVLFGIGMPAWAEFQGPGTGSISVNPPTTGPVSTEGSAAYGASGIQASASSSEKHSTPGYGGSYSGPVYTYEPIPGNVVPAVDLSIYMQNGLLVKPSGPIPGQAACPSGQIGYYVYGPAGQLVSTICVPDTTASGSVPPGPIGALAEQASSQQPWPNLVVAMNPGTGVTGLPSWFWLGGGSATIPPATASAGPLTVTVQATLIDVIWAFGDGTGYDSGSSLGRPYPQQSDVSHNFQADTFSVPGGYSVTATLRFAVSYSVNGGPWTRMGTKARLYSQQYQVNQVQPEGVSRP
jgi:hypothetical protein